MMIKEMIKILHSKDVHQFGEFWGILPNYYFKQIEKTLKLKKAKRLHFFNKKYPIINLRKMKSEPDIYFNKFWVANHITPTFYLSEELENPILIQRTEIAFLILAPIMIDEDFCS